MSSLTRLFTLATLSLTAACARQTYTCCIDGYAETCACPRRDQCLVPKVNTNPDGRCEVAAPLDSGGDSDRGDSASSG
ncbi:MAG: hypothetical protein RIT28_4531 [Pseudomonadota bacterium]